MEQIETFASEYRVRLTRDECGEVIIPGKHGHVFEYGDGERLGIVLLDNDPSLPSKARTLLCQRKKALAAGFIAHQLGDAEAVLLFDPKNPAQTRLALRLVGVRILRRLSDEHRQALLSASRPTQYRRGPAVLEGELPTQKPREEDGEVSDPPGAVEREIAGQERRVVRFPNSSATPDRETDHSRRHDMGSGKG